jgi:branched-chain amino acid transport system permease protein
MSMRALLVFALVSALVAAVGWFMGMAFISLVMLQAVAHALIALGLNVQWGYGGQFVTIRRPGSISSHAPLAYGCPWL